MVTRHEAFGCRLLVEDKSADRNTAAERLRAGHDIRLYAVLLVSPHSPGASHAALDLIQNQQDILLITDLADSLKELRSCRIDTSLSLNCLKEDRAGRIINKVKDTLQIIEFRKYDSAHKRLERILIVGVSCDGQSADGAAVEGALHRDDLMVVLSILHPCIFSCGLDCALDSFRAAVGEENF